MRCLTKIRLLSRFYRNSAGFFELLVICFDCQQQANLRIGGRTMTGSLQIKNDKYYAVLNLKVDGKRKPKWIPLGIPIRGKS